MGFVPTIADNDVYCCVHVNDNKVKYYEYLIVYVDDIICISHNPQKYMDHFKKTYRLREICVPNKFLGSDIKS